MNKKPWQLKWRLRVPKQGGQRNCHAEFTTESAARHEGQRLFDTVADSVTLTNAALKPPKNKVVKNWHRQADPLPRRCR